MHTPERRIAGMVVCFLFLGAVFAAADLKLEQKLLYAHFQDPRLAETTYLPPNEALRLLSFGFEPFAADVVFMEANNYFATRRQYDRRYAWLDEYVDALVGYCRGQAGERQPLPPEECAAADGAAWVDGLFPFNPRVYLWASQAVKWVQQITDDVTDRSVYYGKTGVHFCPDSWGLYFDVGYNLYFEYREKNDEEQERLRKEGLDYFSIAAGLPGSAVDPNFIAQGLWNKAEKQRAIQMIYMTYYHATPDQKKEIRQRVRLYGETELAELFEQEERRWQQDFPYVPESLYHLLGPAGRDGTAGEEVEP